MKGHIVQQILLDINLATESACNSVSCSVCVRVIVYVLCIVLILYLEVVLLRSTLIKWYFNRNPEWDRPGLISGWDCRIVLGWISKRMWSCHMAEYRNQWRVRMYNLIVEGSCLLVNSRMHRFSRNLETHFKIAGARRVLWSKLLNLLKPTGHVMHQQFNLQQLYVLPTLYLCVLYLSENKQRFVPLTA